MYRIDEKKNRIVEERLNSDGYKYIWLNDNNEYFYINNRLPDNVNNYLDLPERITNKWTAISGNTVPITADYSTIISEILVKAKNKPFYQSWLDRVNSIYNRLRTAEKAEQEKRAFFNRDGKEIGK